MKSTETVKYGRYVLKAGSLKNGTRGIAYLGKGKVVEAGGNDVENVIETLKEMLDDLDAVNSEGRRARHIGTVKDYVDAFTKLDFPKSYLGLVPVKWRLPSVKV